jgi:class 3 adenylate cyclase/DNA-binding GntR family transcriptional regulator
MHHNSRLHRLKRPPFRVIPTKPSESKDVAVCFVDIRGFTTFADEAKNKGVKIDKILSCFFESLNTALDQAIKNVKGNPKFRTGLCAFVHPKMTKALGDGAMLVWEYPPDVWRDSATKPNPCHAGLSLLILDFIGYLQVEFEKTIARLNRSRGYFRTNLHLGIGLSKGQAWKTNGLGSKGIDYFGTPVNEASRFQNLARPCGIVVGLDVAPQILLERCCFEIGYLDKHSIKGLPEKTLPLWLAIAKPGQEKIPWRKHRKEGIGGIGYDDNFQEYDRPLTERDTLSIFDLRAEIEGGFAKELARRVESERINSTELQLIAKTITDMEALRTDPNFESEENQKRWNHLGREFHRRIAFLSGPENCKEREQAVECLHSRTRRIVPLLFKQIPHESVAKDHTEILRWIKAGDPRRAKDSMRNHIHGHYDEATKPLENLPIEESSSIPCSPWIRLDK